MCCLAQFQEVSAQQNIYANTENPFHGAGCSFIDFDLDGWDDLTLSGKNEPPLFFKNNNGNFIPYQPIFNPPIASDLDGKCPLWFDYDNDGDRDFLYSELYDGVQLYRNDENDQFTEVTAEAGITVAYGRCMGMALGDYNKDGNLDFFVCKFHNAFIDFGANYANQFFRNNGDGTFTDVTLEAGFGQTVQASFMPVFSDLNRDGWQDLYIINDKVNPGNYFFLNNGDGTFSNISESSGAGIHIEAMSGTIDDYDNDNDLDIFVSNTYSNNNLLNNDGNGNFVEIGVEAGVSGYNAMSENWGGLWIDYDNNTLQDLFVCNSPLGFNVNSYNDFFVNNGDGSFTYSSVLANIQDHNNDSYTCAMGDMNLDGYYDFVVTNQNNSYDELWQNDGGANHFISVELVGTASNRDGIGTYIDIWCNGSQYTRYTHGGENYLCQNSTKEIFGLADASIVDSLRLQWQSGLTEMYYRIPVDQFLKLTEGEALNALISYTDTLPLCFGDTALLDAGNWLDVLWNDGSMNRYLNAVSAGTYSAEITDYYGNVFLTDSVHIEYRQPLEMNVYGNSPACYNTAGGSIELNYSLDSIVHVFLNGIEIFGTFYTDLYAGTYDLQTVDIFGCSASQSVLLENPEEMVATISVTHPKCFGENSGSAEIAVTGGHPDYTMDWQADELDSLAAGVYNFWVVDSYNCALNSSFTLIDPEEITSAAETMNVSCFGKNNGSIIVATAGGTGLLYVDYFGENPDSLVAGNYTYSVIDESGCQIVVPYVIQEPAELSAAIATTAEFEGASGGSAELTLSGGTLPYEVTWSNGAVDSMLVHNLNAGEYYVICMDGNGCELDSLFNIDFISSINEKNEDAYFVYPNPVADVFRISFPEEIVNATIVLTDVNGKIVLNQKATRNPESISTFGLPSGFYIVYIYTVNLVHTEKIMIE